MATYLQIIYEKASNRKCFLWKSHDIAEKKHIFLNANCFPCHSFTRSIASGRTVCGVKGQKTDCCAQFSFHLSGGDVIETENHRHFNDNGFHVLTNSHARREVRINVHEPEKKGEHIEREAEWILANAMAKIRNTGIGKNTSWNGIFRLSKPVEIQLVGC